MSHNAIYQLFQEVCIRHARLMLILWYLHIDILRQFREALFWNNLAWINVLINSLLCGYVTEALKSHVSLGCVKSAIFIIISDYEWLVDWLRSWKLWLVENWWCGHQSYTYVNVCWWYGWGGKCVLRISKTARGGRGALQLHSHTYVLVHTHC